MNPKVKQFKTFEPAFEGQTYENKQQGLKTPEAVEKSRAGVAKKYPRPKGGSGFIGTNQVD
jgi:hypothetical protein